METGTGFMADLLLSDKREGPPKVIFVLSGKRKCGKDFVAELLCRKLASQTPATVRLSGPLKSQYAKEHGLDYKKLLDATSYKETYRKDMIGWGEEVRHRDPGYFCRHACEQAAAWGKPVWIVSDARRPTDIAYFQENFGGQSAVKTVRISAETKVREQRGWRFVAGVDDEESECGLDTYVDWDFCIQNDGENSKDIEAFLERANTLATS